MQRATKQRATKKRSTKWRHVLMLPALLSAATIAPAAELQLEVGIPQLNVAEYHRPYVAFWIEDAAGKATTLAVWYDTKLAANEGAKWLKDMRQWWRKSGREQDWPVDGISGATRPVGEHRLQFSGKSAPLKDLAAGDYVLRVEAAREVGGRELLEIPFQWPPKKAQQLRAQGKAELAGLVLTLKP